MGSSSEWECGVSVWSECVSVWIVQVNVSIGLDMNRYM